MKMIDKRETQKQNKKSKNKQRHNRTRGTEATVKGLELNDFFAHQ